MAPSTKKRGDISKEEKEMLLHFLQRVRKNVEIDWDIVKKGNRREY
jgi:hypothetical protein